MAESPILFTSDQKSGIFEKNSFPVGVVIEVFLMYVTPLQTRRESVTLFRYFWGHSTINSHPAMDTFSSLAALYRVSHRTSNIIIGPPGVKTGDEH